jgi:stress-induced morphogen
MLTAGARNAIINESRGPLGRITRLSARAIATRATISPSALSSSQARASLSAGSISNSTPRSSLRAFTRSSARQEEAEKEEEKKELDDGEKNIHDILTREFNPTHLQVSDVSGKCDMDRGELESRLAHSPVITTDHDRVPSFSGGCGSFYAIVIASSEFNGKPTVKAHRLVNEALKDVISGIHGLQVSLVCPNKSRSHGNVVSRWADDDLRSPSHTRTAANDAGKELMTANAPFQDCIFLSGNAD